MDRCSFAARREFRNAPAWTPCVRSVALAAALLGTGAASAQLPGMPPPAVDAPWYVGAAQGFGYDSNVARASGGDGGGWSSTSLLAGFDQRLGRQRLYGRAGVSLNRYFDQSEYDNTGYNLLAGVDWETVQNLSGKLEAGLDSRLVRPAVAEGADSARNVERTQRLQGVARWGGTSLLMLEGTFGHARVDQSASTYDAQESRATAGSLGLYYNRGGALRLGIVARYDTVRWPRALDDGGTTGGSDRVRSRGAELAVNYDDGGVIAARSRLGYMRSTHSNPALEAAAFSGVTGSVAVDVRATGKLLLTAYAARDPNLNPLTVSTATATAGPPPGPGTEGGGGAAPVYQQNVLTTTLGTSAHFQATAKVVATARVQHARARLVGTAETGGAGGGTDTRQTAGLGLRYELTRSIGLGCGYEHERRRITGPAAASYSANAVGCTGAFVLR